MNSTRLLSSLALGAIMGTTSVALTSCDNNSSDSADLRAGNEIRFSASTDLSRAGDFTTNNLKTFNVFAFTGAATKPTTFMNNVTVTKGANNVWTYSPVEYWPAGQEVDFYAFAPASWIEGGTTPLAPMPYANYYADQDLIYAVAPNLTGNNGQPNAQVVFNFRHALSKLDIKMSCTNPGIDVRVSNVVVVGLNTMGNFIFPHVSTAGYPSAESIGSWSGLNTPALLMFHISSTPNELLHLSSTPIDLGFTGTASEGPKYVIPQPLPWTGNGGDGDAYIAVQASVYDKETGVKLWPNGNTPDENIVEGSLFGDGIMKFPLKVSYYNEFMPGVSYTYNIQVNGSDHMGQIEFGQPSVDTYIDVVSNYD